VTQRINSHGLQVDSDLYDFITHTALPGTGVDADSFWAEFGAIVDDLTAENRALLVEVVDELNKMDGQTRARVKMVTEFGGADFDINWG